MTRNTKEETRLQILDAALKVFSEYGYASSTLPQLAKAAGVAVGTIYVHFSDKQELVNELYCFWKRELYSSLEIGSKDDAPRDRFRSFWKSYMDFGLKNKEAMDFMERHHHVSYLNETSREVASSIIASYIMFVEEMVDAKAFKPVNPVMLLAVLHGIAMAVLEKMWHGHLESNQENLDQAEQLCWEAVRT